MDRAGDISPQHTRRHARLKSPQPRPTGGSSSSPLQWSQSPRSGEDEGGRYTLAQWSTRRSRRRGSSSYSTSRVPLVAEVVAIKATLLQIKCAHHKSSSRPSTRSARPQVRQNTCRGPSRTIRSPARQTAARARRRVRHQSRRADQDGPHNRPPSLPSCGSIAGHPARGIDRRGGSVCRYPTQPRSVSVSMTGTAMHPWSRRGLKACMCAASSGPVHDQRPSRRFASFLPGPMVRAGRSRIGYCWRSPDRAPASQFPGSTSPLRTAPRTTNHERSIIISQQENTNIRACRSRPDSHRQGAAAGALGAARPARAPSASEQRWRFPKSRAASSTGPASGPDPQDLPAEPAKTCKSQHVVKAAPAQDARAESAPRINERRPRRTLERPMIGPIRTMADSASAAGLDSSIDRLCDAASPWMTPR